MCNIDSDAQHQIMAIGLSIINAAMEASLNANNPVMSSDVLGTATQAYQQGKITKNQFMAVINALDEAPRAQTAWVERSNSIVQRQIKHKR